MPWKDPAGQAEGPGKADTQMLEAVQSGRAGWRGGAMVKSARRRRVPVRGS